MSSIAFLHHPETRFGWTRHQSIETPCTGHTRHQGHGSGIFALQPETGCEHAEI
jgi:hypothetical protein